MPPIQLAKRINQVMMLLSLALATGTALMPDLMAFAAA